MPITSLTDIPDLALWLDANDSSTLTYAALYDSILPNSTYGTINSISINDFGNMVMATSKGIFYSYNFGKDWNISNANTTYNWLSISLINNGNALACTSSAVYFSSNNGNTWTITGAPSGYTYFSICLSSSGYAIAIGLNTSSLNSSGNFSTWSSSNIGIQPYTIGLANNGVGIAGGNQHLATTKNNGATWTVKSQGGSGPVPWANGGNISDNGAYMIANNNNSPGNLYYSTNSGDTWYASNNTKSNLAGNLAVGNNGIAFNRQNNTPAAIQKTDLTTDKNMVYTGYDQVAANVAICPSGLFVSFIVANDGNSKKLIVKTA